MTDRKGLPFLHPASLIATWFGSGLLPIAPGTWGSAAALPFAAAIMWLSGPEVGPWALLAASVLAFLIGLWASERYATALGKDDPGPVVIDEVAGQWLTLVPAGLDPLLYLVGFLAFRVFDVLKPWPAGWMDRTLKGGLGIMLDDMVAGLYGALVCFGIATWVL